MRPTTVSVGPLASASANNICTTQTPAGAGQLVLAGTTVTKTFQGTASITTSVMTVSAVSSGVVTLGMAVNGAGITAGTVVTGFLTGTGGTGTYVISINQTFSSGTIYGNPVATLDTPRRVLLTTNGDETAKTLTIIGTGWNNDAQTEVLTGVSSSTAYTNLDFLTITSISASAAFAAAVTIGTNGVASSRWVRFDEYAPAPVTVQCVVSGTVSYTVQESMQDPNSPTSPTLPYLMAWSSSLDTNVVAATATKLSYFNNAPIWARILLNSETGAGFVTGIFAQSSNAPY